MPGAYTRARNAYGTRSGNLSPTQRKLKRNRSQARTLRKAAQRTARNRPKGKDRGSVPGHQSQLSEQGLSSVNRVTSGAGSQRQGQRYRLFKDAQGNHYHVYGKGPKARKVKLSKSVAKAYGYS